MKLRFLIILIVLAGCRGTIPKVIDTNEVDQPAEMSISCQQWSGEVEKKGVPGKDVDLGLVEPGMSCNVRLFKYSDEDKQSPDGLYITEFTLDWDFEQHVTLNTTERVYADVDIEITNN